MKIAVQVGLLPGETAADKAKWARDHGADGVEMNAWGVPARQAAPGRRGGSGGGAAGLQRLRELGPLPDGTPSFDFLDPDPAQAQEERRGVQVDPGALRRTRAAGQIVPPDLRGAAGAGPVRRS
jgi:hypothetical protein